MSHTVRLAVINSHPIQYFAPLYAFLNQSPELDMTALYCCDAGLRASLDPGFKQALMWDIDLLSGYRAVFLGKRASKRNPAGFWSLIVPEIWSEIRSGRYDVIWLHGYNHAAYLIAFMAAKSIGLPIIMRGETHLGLRRSAINRLAHRFIFSRFFKWIDAFLAIGSANRRYYLSLGVAEDKIFDVPYTVDNRRFMAASALSVEALQAVRNRFGLPLDRPVILFASKFMRRKHPDDLMRAAARLQGLGYRFSLLMIGSGEMDEELRSLAERLALKDVVFGGLLNQTELPEAYAASDVFVLPSEDEPWGLIVNEVMCVGIPVIVSDEVGSAFDLVKEGVNGYKIKANDLESLTHALARVLDDPTLRAEMGRHSLALIGHWSYEQCRIGILKALDALLPDRHS